MPETTRRTDPSLPFIRATSPVDDTLRGALTRRGQEKLALIGTRLRFGARHVIFSRHDPALYIYNVTEGIVRSYRERASGRRQVLAFLFAGDLIGLSSRGRYVNCTETLTPVTVFRFPLPQLVALASGDATLAWTLMCKSNQTLREAQRHTLLVSCTDPAARVAMFLSVMENTAPGGRGRIPVPLGVADIAEYVDLAPAAVTRALSDLQRSGVIRRDGAKAVRIADRPLFDTLVAGGHL